MATLTGNGMVTIPTKFSGPETVQRIESALQAKGLTIFAIIDHSGEAEKVGLNMPFTQVIVFGSPAAGTPLMLARWTVALDLPLKALVRETDTGTEVSFNSPDYLQERHNIPAELLPNIAGAGMLLQKAVQ